jgi:hypothetical protein
MGKAELKGLDLEDLVLLSGDIHAIESGEEHAFSLFPPKEAEVKVDLKDKLKAQVGKPAAADKASGPPPQTIEGIAVRTGVKPFTWLVNDGFTEVLVVQADNVFTCNCKPKCTDCAHITATQHFAAPA